jgi:hypothetical protein
MQVYTGKKIGEPEEETKARKWSKILSLLCHWKRSDNKLLLILPACRVTTHSESHTY